MGKGDYLGEFEQTVLWALARCGEPAYGMTIHDAILEATGRDVSIPSVYVTLARLEKKGLVSSREGDPTPARGGRAKKFYRILPAGIRALRESRAMLENLWKGVRLAADREER